MPSSHPMIISPILEAVMYTNPSTVLDIGVGMGKFGALLREYTEASNLRLHKDWKTKINGIEIFRDYRNPIWRCYDHVMIGDATQLIDTLPDYDLILMSEVLEHLPKDVGQLMLQMIM